MYHRVQTKGYCEEDLCTHIIGEMRWSDLCQKMQPDSHSFNVAHTQNREPISHKKEDNNTDNMHLFILRNTTPILNTFFLVVHT